MSILNINRHLAVVGDPIDHSKSPQLHEAAYRVLGLEWEYSRQRIPEGQLAGFVDGCDDAWRGLSVTMPLKVEAFEVATHHEDSSRLTGVANTLLFDTAIDTAIDTGIETANDGVSRRTIHAFNTDIAGLVNPLRAVGVGSVDSGTIIGSGATALSAVVALSQLGCSSLTVVGRSESSAHVVVSLAKQLGMTSTFVPLEHLGNVSSTRVTISTTPGRANVELGERQIDPGDVLFDIAYDTWPSTNAEAWTKRGGRTLSGLSMLAAQALEQVRIFVSGQPEGVLDREDEVRLAMNAAVGLDESGLFVRSVG